MNLESLSIRVLPKNGGFIINAAYYDNTVVNDDTTQFTFEEKVATSPAKLKKIIKFYLDELKEKNEAA